MRVKTTRKEAIAKVASAMMDRWKADQIIQRLRADPFTGVFLQLAEIYGDLGEPFLTVNPSTQEPELNIDLSPGRPTKLKQGVQPPLLAMDHSVIQGRQLAEEAAQRIIAVWAKAGIPSMDVTKILNTIAPSKKRFLAQLAREHSLIVSSIEAQRERCFQITHLVFGLMVLPSEVRSQIVTATMGAMETCTIVLKKLGKADPIIAKAKREFLHVRNPRRGDAEAGLMRLREKHLRESKAARARATARLLKAFDPDTAWNANSIRAGRAYPKP